MESFASEFNAIISTIEKDDIEAMINDMAFELYRSPEALKEVSSFLENPHTNMQNLINATSICPPLKVAIEKWMKDRIIERKSCEFKMYHH